jgi:hypothetical protein
MATQPFGKLNRQACGTAYILANLISKFVNLSKHQYSILSIGPVYQEHKYHCQPTRLERKIGELIAPIYFQI